MYLAAIDIGSNAIRLLIKNTQHLATPDNLDTIYPDEYYERIPLKSGIDVFKNQRITPPTEAILTVTLSRWAKIIKRHQVAAYRACATAAYREALNGTEVAQRVGAASGLKVEIIPGQEEARITRLSYVPAPEWQNDYLLFVDVGGGSTEVSLLRKGETLFSHSFRVGSMRYLCGNQSADEEQALDRAMADILLRTHDHPLHYIGVGGCVKFFRKLLAQSDTDITIHVARMREVYTHLCTLTPAQISDQYRLPMERADILTPASSIFLRIAHTLNVPQIIVPSIGVRNGIITELYYQNKDNHPI